ncbi:MAG: lysylphosphatidylglycerol synthase domain-containing protein [bacterium]
MSKELALVMPVYNEAECIARVLSSWLAEFKRLGIDYIAIVLDDGSTDGTAEQLAAFAEHDRVECIQKMNEGHGPTVLRGYRRAIELADWVFQCDSDDEMSPASFVRLWEIRENHDAVFGHRQGRRQSPLRRLVTWTSRATIRFCFGNTVRDVNTPYRLLRSDCLRAVLPRIPADTFAPNVLLAGAASRQRWRTAELPVPHRPRRTGTVSLLHFGLWRAAGQAFWQTMKFRFGSPAIVASGDHGGSTLSAGWLAESPVSPWRRVLSVVLRLIVAVVLLGWLVRSGRLDPAALLELRLGARELSLLVGSSLAVTAGLLLLGLRLRWLLAAVGLQVEYRQAVRVTAMGAFSSMLLPGLVGGDVVKATALCRDIQQGKRIAVGAVLADRFVGIYALFLVAALAVGYGWTSGTLPSIPDVLVILPPAVCLGAPAVLLLARFLVSRLHHRPPPGWFVRFEPLLAGLGALAGNPRLLPAVLGLGLANHALVILSFVVAGELLGTTLSLQQHAVVDPLAMTLNALPISPGGLGLSESAFSYLYESMGHPHGAAIGMLGRLLQYLVIAAAGVCALFARARTVIRPVTGGQRDDL